MKYRKLTPEELKGLESEFIRFLASNTVTADDWVKIKEQDKQKAEHLIELFSDIVIGQTLEKVKYLDLKRPKDIRSFHCEKERIYLKGLIIEGDTNLAFNLDELPEKMLAQLKDSDAEIQLINAEKAYREDRELELFRLIEQGALISKDGHLYKMLGKLSGE
jgi:hypothetical protein